MAGTLRILLAPFRLIRIKSIEIGISFKARWNYYQEIIKRENHETRIIGRVICSRYGSTNKPGWQSSRLAIFVAYHPGQTTPASNLAYLTALRDSGFRIIYVHNGPLDHESDILLRSLCEEIWIRKNTGQDFGAWQDALKYLWQGSSLNDIEWLLMCNDSNFFLDGSNATDFIQKFTRELANADIDLIALNKNYEERMHYQSYFLCYRHKIFSSPSFTNFWKKYIPLNSRYHAIVRGEIELTRQVLQNTTASILYTSHDLLSAIIHHKVRLSSLVSMLPIRAQYLSKLAKSSCHDERLAMIRIFSILDMHNPSHAYGLAFAMYLHSPFLKKDLIRMGVNSFWQVSSCISAGELECTKNLQSQIINAFEVGGTSASYIGYPKTAIERGIPTDGAPFRTRSLDILRDAGL